MTLFHLVHRSEAVAELKMKAEFQLRAMYPLKNLLSHSLLGLFRCNVFCNPKDPFLLTFQLVFRLGAEKE